MSARTKPRAAAEQLLLGRQVLALRRQGLLGKKIAWLQIMGRLPMPQGLKMACLLDMGRMPGAAKMRVRG